MISFKSIFILISFIIFAVTLGVWALDVHETEICNRVHRQLLDHHNLGLYPGFYITDDERAACKNVGRPADYLSKWED